MLRVNLACVTACVTAASPRKKSEESLSSDFLRGEAAVTQARVNPAMA